MSGLISHRGAVLARPSLQVLDVVVHGCNFPSSSGNLHTTPAGARAAGDVLVAFLRQPSPGVAPSPSGWTQQFRNASTFQTVWSRTATGTSADDFAYTTTGTGAEIVTWMSLRGPATPTVTYSNPTQSVVSAVVWATITSPGVGLDVLVGMMGDSTTAPLSATLSTPTGFSLERNATYSDASANAIYVKAWVFTRGVTAGATGTASATQSAGVASDCTRVTVTT